MKKEDWQSLYKIFDEQHSRFLMHYPTAQSGRNKQVRAVADREVSSAISLVTSYLTRNQEVYDLVMVNAGPTDYGRAIVYDEFVQPRYFGGDMTDLLQRMKSKIDSM
jgi:hypothetical protein